MLKTFRLIISLTFVLSAAMFAAAQTEKPQPVAPGKIALINTKAFEDEKTGVTDFIEIYKKLDEEFKPQLESLKTMYEKLLKLQKEFEEINKRFKSGIYCSEEDAEESSNKLKEHKLLSDKFKTEQEAARALFDKRKAELSAGTNKKIAAALKQFAKEKGYAVVFDAAKIENILIGTNENFIDITGEFIRFYNESFNSAGN
jgi:Skp family chaperone for outer membrane proteins